MGFGERLLAGQYARAIVGRTQRSAVPATPVRIIAAATTTTAGAASLRSLIRPPTAGRLALFQSIGAVAM
ncbi:hypothetical protein RISK_001069 [Rhodopirellula islandica]|uniref:Uncharacterized protein n=1 Tax=Rhodopirellula islandica TaxID=595434 RepID=A0A0J1BK43_RHOIS|nr:hypothetical protein RISK_001069 [Rhodopirellula islandica]